MQGVGLIELARGPAAGMNHQFTVASQAWSGDLQQPEHRPLAQIKYDAFVTSAHYIYIYISTGRADKSLGITSISRLCDT